MAILSDEQILECLNTGRLVIDPRPQLESIGPSTVDLRLGSKFTRPRRIGGQAVQHLIDTRDPEAVNQAISELSALETIPNGQCIHLGPNEFVLGWTLERIELPADLGARIEGRSTYARLGLSIHQTAPIVHPTFKGHLRLEMVNIGPYTLQLYPGQSICQLLVEEMSAPARGILDSTYQGQTP